MRSQTLIVALSVLAASGALLGVGSLAISAGNDPAAVPAEIPTEAKQMKNPEQATPQSIADGKQIYSSQCAMCHGVNGDGKSDLAARFGYKMPDFTNPEFQKTHTDGEYYYVLTNGHGKMAGEGNRLGDKTRWNLVNYIRSLVKP